MHLAAKRLREKAGALATISRFVPVFRARLQLWAARSERGRQERAAVVIQSHMRRRQVQRRTATSVRGITRLQVKKRVDALGLFVSPPLHLWGWEVGRQEMDFKRPCWCTATRGYCAQLPGTRGGWASKISVLWPRRMIGR